ELSRQVGEQLHRFEGLESAKHAGYRPQYTRFGAVANNSVACRFRPYTAQAGRAGANDLQLSLVLIYACKNNWFAELHAAVVEQELRREVIGAINYEIVLTDQVRSVFAGEAVCVAPDVNIRVQRAHAIGCQFCFRLADIRERIHCLTVQVRGFQTIPINKTQPADASASQVADDGYTEAAAADHEYTTGAEFCLTGGTDFLQRHLARVVGNGRANTRVY